MRIRPIDAATKQQMLSLGLLTCDRKQRLVVTECGVQWSRILLAVEMLTRSYYELDGEPPAAHANLRLLQGGKDVPPPDDAG